MSRLVIGRKKYWGSAKQAVAVTREKLEENGHVVEFEPNGTGMHVARCKHCRYLTIVRRTVGMWFVFGQALDEECPRIWG